LGFGANNKKIIAYANPELPKIYLSSIDDEADVADLKAVKILTSQCHGAPTPVQQHRRNDIILHMQHLRGITHIQCIYVIQSSVQQNSRRRRIWTRNLVARRRLTRGVSSNSLAQLQTWEPSQEKRGRERNE
jgi:hypothetical protein